MIRVFRTKFSGSMRCQTSNCRQVEIWINLKSWNQISPELRIRSREGAVNGFLGINRKHKKDGRIHAAGGSSHNVATHAPHPARPKRLGGFVGPSTSPKKGARGGLIAPFLGLVPGQMHRLKGCGCLWIGLCGAFHECLALCETRARSRLPGG